MEMNSNPYPTLWEDGMDHFNSIPVSCVTPCHRAEQAGDFFVVFFLVNPRVFTTNPDAVKVSYFSTRVCCNHISTDTFSSLPKLWAYSNDWKYPGCSELCQLVIQFHLIVQCIGAKTF